MNAMGIMGVMGIMGMSIMYIIWLCVNIRICNNILVYDWIYVSL